LTVKILLDTDIGSDIDDAVCLAYLLAQKDCELLGITTVSGEADQRARLASTLCKQAGREIPIYPGKENPLLVSQRQPTAPQAEALEGWDYQHEFPQNSAVEFLSKTIHSYPGEITLLAIGPLTNIAILFALDPEIPFLLKEIYTMCGAFTNDNPELVRLEWNAICDPHAAAIVFQERFARHRSIGLDVTEKICMDAAEVKERLKGNLLEPVLDFVEYWFQEEDTLTFHDPLAAALLFDDEICDYEKGTVSVDLALGKTLGLTAWEGDPNKGRHEVPFNVNVERFFDHYFSVMDI